MENIIQELDMIGKNTHSIELLIQLCLLSRTCFRYSYTRFYNVLILEKPINATFLVNSTYKPIVRKWLIYQCDTILNQIRGNILYDDGLILYNRLLNLLH